MAARQMTDEDLAKQFRTQQMHRTNKEPNRNGTSGARGVSWSERRKKWRAYVSHNRRQMWIGEFRDKAVAIEAVNRCRESVIEKAKREDIE